MSRKTRQLLTNISHAVMSQYKGYECIMCREDNKKKTAGSFWIKEDSLVLGICEDTDAKVVVIREFSAKNPHTLIHLT